MQGQCCLLFISYSGWNQPFGWPWGTDLREEHRLRSFCRFTSHSDSSAVGQRESPSVSESQFLRPRNRGEIEVSTCCYKNMNSCKQSVCLCIKCQACIRNSLKLRAVHVPCAWRVHQGRGLKPRGWSGNLKGLVWIWESPILWVDEIVFFWVGGHGGSHGDKVNTAPRKKLILWILIYWFPFGMWME